MNIAAKSVRGFDPKTLLLVLSLGLPPAHAATLQEQAEAAAAADGITTLGGLALGAAEANPLGLVSLLAKVPMLAYVKTLPRDEQAEWHATYGAIWGGAAANNLCIAGAILTGGVLAPLCPMVGMAWGIEPMERLRHGARAVGDLPPGTCLLEQPADDVRFLQAAGRLRSTGRGHP
jgi:hypothetical protein